MAAQTATHFPKQEMQALGGLEACLRTTDQLNTQELSDWTTLWTIVGPGRRLAVGEEAQLRQALSRAVYDAKLMPVSALQMFAQIADNHLLSDDELAQIRRASTDESKRYAQKLPVCLPIGPAPADYGGSPFKFDLTAPMPPPS